MSELSTIERDLRDAGQAYLETRGANSDELRSIMEVAIGLGVPREAVAHVTGVPVANIRELLTRGCDPGGRSASALRRA
jgi:hypothetical protein